MSLLWEISGSGPLGRGLASQQVCCTTLPGCRPAFCSVITYRLGAEEADGRDVNTHKKTDPNNTSSRHRKKEKEQWTLGKCNRSLRTVLKSNITPVGAGMKLTVSWIEHTQHMNLEKQRFPCWRLCLSSSPLTQTPLTFYPEAPQKKKKKPHAVTLECFPTWPRKWKEPWVTSIEPFWKRTACSETFTGIWKRWKKTPPPKMNKRLNKVQQLFKTHSVKRNKLYEKLNWRLGWDVSE